MPHPASRVLGMLELLQTHHRLTGVELAGRLGVDERTVRRYAATLGELGIPVTAARGRYGGYQLAPGYRLPPLMLTDNEAIAVVLGLVAAERWGLSTEEPAARIALAKIRRVLPAPLVDRLAAVQETLGFTLPRPEAAAGPAAATLLTLGTAARERQRVRLGYRSWRGGTSLRELDPYGVVFHKGKWYVVGHDHRHGEVRTFRLDRIGPVGPVGPVGAGEATFTVPDGFDPVGHVTRSLAAVPYAWEVEVLLETDLAEARRRVPATAAQLTETTTGGVRLIAQAERLDGMAQMLAGLGWPFTVVRPDELRQAVLDHAARLAGYARRSGHAERQSSATAE